MTRADNRWQVVLGACLIFATVAGFVLSGCGARKERHRGNELFDRAPKELLDRYRAPDQGTTQDSSNARGMGDYKKAIEAVQAERYEEAQTLLEKAAAANPEFTEAWYNLGATHGVLAVIAAHENNDQAALTHFKEAVTAKRKAKELMDQGKFVFYNKSQQDEVRADVIHALEDADTVLRDERSLLIALRMTPIPRH